MKDSVFNQLTVFFWNIFCLNLVFIASNIVLIGALLFVIVHWVTLPLYVITFFLFIVSFQAMLLTIKRWKINERNLQLEEISIFRQYMSAYREEFKNAYGYAISYLLVVLILGIGYIGIPFVIANSSVFTVTYLLLFVLLYIHFIFVLLIQIHFVIDMKGTLRLGLYCISKYPLQCLLILGITLLVIIFVRWLPEMLFLGIIPFSGYLLNKVTGKVFEELKDVLQMPEETRVHESH